MTNEKKLEKKCIEVMQKVTELDKIKQDKLQEFQNKTKELDAEKQQLLDSRPEKLNMLDTQAVVEIDARLDQIDKELEIVSESMEKYKASAGLQNSDIVSYEKELKNIIRVENESAFNEAREHIKAILILYQNYVKIQNRGNEVIKVLESRRTDKEKVRYTSDTNLYTSNNNNLNINSLLKGNYLDELSAEALGKSYNKFLESIIYY